MSTDHNVLTNRFMKELVHDFIKGGGTREEFCVFLESTVFGSMMILTDYYKMRPEHASTYVDEILQGALERFVKARNLS